ncbi:natural killer cell receptor 2B4-like [Misgurnus anguillicaudatus]|uniref:natural killer cell receptor 2B4-like n=1 Tax=Misgurnus anguillicaudatus TaxID=75329 RepID=UPI003CCF01A9
MSTTELYHENTNSELTQCFNHFLCFCVLVVFGVDGDEVKSVSVVEGDSVTLHTNITEIQTDDRIVWMFGPQDTLIAEISKKIIDMFDSKEIFGDRLKLDSQTGSLTITNITTDSGLYKLTIISTRGTSYKRFNVTVYAPLPIPVISSNSSQCSSSSSSSKCVLLCSVMNVRDVSLSWYKGNSLLSSISVSDLKNKLCLPLEVKYQDTNTYSCVVNNPIKKQTQHLNITHLCQMCSEESGVTALIVLILISGVLLVFVSSRVIHCYCRKYQQTKQEDEKDLSEYTEIIYRLQIRLQ